ncbi:MAG TPA: hypothetical protein VLK22_02705 [Candidatus Udaeobacter sp.]|nr:hypothetical protein [Candidatus Udaeobacter sp.]
MQKKNKLPIKIFLIFIFFLFANFVLKINPNANASEIGCCQKIESTLVGDGSFIQNSIEQCWHTRPENCTSYGPGFSWEFKPEPCNTIQECASNTQPAAEAKCDANGCEDITQAPTNFSKLQADVLGNKRKPLLEINIPGLNFSDLASSSDDTGTYIYVPWIQELISALYKFGIAIVSIVAVVIIIIQGMRVIVSGGGEGTGEAYKKIFQSIIGLFIAWGSYAILYNINPSLVQFKALKVKVVERVELPAVLQMQTTQGDTLAKTDNGATPGTYTPRFSSCPITLTSASSNDKLSARTKEFFEKIGSGSTITGATPAERVLQIADAAVECGIAMGSCGRTAGEIYNLAGVITAAYPNSSCLLTNHGCEPQGDKEVHSLPRAIILNSLVTHTDGTIVPITDVQKLVFGENIPGWPDAWADQLQPGDAIWVYNGNAFGGNHTAIFVGWGSGGNAQVIQGSAGLATFRGSLCIKKECGDKMLPIIKTFRPK